MGEVVLDAFKEIEGWQREGSEERMRATLPLRGGGEASKGTQVSDGGFP